MTPVSSVSNGLYFLTLLLVSVMRVIYTSKGMSKKFRVRVIYQKIWYKQNNQIVHLCTKIHFFLLFHHLLSSNKQIPLLIPRYEEVQNIIQQSKHIYITTVFHTDFVTNSIYTLDVVFLYTPHLEDHSDYHST
jgi:hypothetical protein